MFKRATLLLCLLLPVACASSGGATGRDSSRLTADEIQSVDVSTLYDVVQRLRPRWLDVRATTGFNGTDDIVVFQGQSLVGGTETLRQFTPAGWNTSMGRGHPTRFRVSAAGASKAPSSCIRPTRPSLTGRAGSISPPLRIARRSSLGTRRA